MANQLPLIAAAFVCERVLKEGDVFSAIRIIDTFTARIVRLTRLTYNEQIPADEPSSVVGPIAANTDQVIDASALIMVRAGDLRGKHELTVEMKDPTGKSVKYPEPFRIDFAKNDPAEAATLVIKFVLAGSSPAGRYWINVFWNGQPLTKIPLKLVKESESQASESGAERSQ